jgi:hypothetical protein
MDYRGARPAATVNPEADLRLAVVDRVAGSPLFKDSKRLRDLFLFLCERALADPDAVIHEQEIGVAVFCRPPDYDTSQDTLVRVHASRLRKKLQQYFDAEPGESVVVEIPKGGYTPVFRPRETPPTPGPAAIRPRLPWSFPRALRLPFAILGIVACALVAYLLLANSRTRPPVQPAAESRPTVDRFWQQVFVNGRQTCLVLSDSALTLFEDLLHRQLDLNEYRRKDFAVLADEALRNPEQRAMAKTIMAKFFTHTADAGVAWKIGILNSAHQVPTDVVFARSFAISYLQSHNVILLGSRRANPWLELFENQMNFRSEFQEVPPVSYFRNYAPLPGESAVYRGSSWQREGYCRVAFLPNLTHRGNLLVISGTSLASTEAGGEFITSERWMRALSANLGLGRKDPFPYFEVLLHADLLQADSAKFEIVAHRISKT